MPKKAWATSCGGWGEPEGNSTSSCPLHTLQFLPWDIRLHFLPAYVLTLCWLTCSGQTGHSSSRPLEVAGPNWPHTAQAAVWHILLGYFSVMFSPNQQKLYLLYLSISGDSKGTVSPYTRCCTKTPKTGNPSPDPPLPQKSCCF